MTTMMMNSRIDGNAALRPKFSLFRVLLATVGIAAFVVAFVSVMGRHNNRNNVQEVSIAITTTTTTTELIIPKWMMALTEQDEQQQHRRLNLIDEDEPLPPLFPFQSLDYVGFGLAVLGLMLAAGAGIGGGGILVPIYILVLEFPVKHAIPLASATVFGGSIANNILNLGKKHPDVPSRPLIDYDMLLTLEPMTIAGALVGALLNSFLPDLLLVVCMVILLAATSHKTLVKACSLYKKESEAIANEQKVASQIVNEKLPLLPSKDIEAQNTTSTVSSDSSGCEMDVTATNSNNDDSNNSTSEEVKQQVTKDILKLSLLFIVVTMLNLLKGGPEDGGGPAGLPKCGIQCYWSTQLVILIIIVSFSIQVRHQLLARTKSGGVALSDIEWDDKNTISYPLMAVIAGLVAGLFGVGGGIIKGPLMLALGVHPAVASATSACMIFFTSATSTVSYSIYGLLVPDYAAFCLAVGFFSTLVGQKGMNIILKRYKRNSLIAFCIGFLVLISAIAMTVESVLALLSQES